jgi:hypothetical protein
MRRFAVVVGAVALAFSAALAIPVQANASGLHALAVGCSDTAYPPSPHATIMSSTTTPLVGQTIEASGTAYCPNEDVRLTLAGAFVGTTHTDGTGAFDPPLKVTKLGSQPLCGIGASGLPNDRDCITLIASTPHGTNGGGGGTSFTGVDILLLCALAAGLIAVGWALLTAGRRKRLTMIKS